jgi:hypothetical protein
VIPRSQPEGWRYNGPAEKFPSSSADPDGMFGKSHPCKNRKDGVSGSRRLVYFIILMIDSMWRIVQITSAKNPIGRTKKKTRRGVDLIGTLNTRIVPKKTLRFPVIAANSKVTLIPIPIPRHVMTWVKQLSGMLTNANPYVQVKDRFMQLPQYLGAEFVSPGADKPSAH